MSDFANLIRSYTKESGEIIDVPPVTVDEVVANELVVASEPQLAEVLTVADKSEAFAEQLEELADRADAVASEDPGVVAISTESLNREFTTIMRAYGGNFKSHSFESATSDAGRLQGISKDARMFAGASRKLARDTGAFSPEGIVKRFMRVDTIRLKDARDALQSEIPKLKAHLGSMKDKPVAFSHSGIAKFLTQEGKGVTNIKTAIADDAKYLDKVTAAVDKIGQDIISRLNTLKSGKAPSGELAALTNIVSGLATKPGELLGNYGVSIKASDGKVPKISRSVDSKFHKEAAVRGGIVAVGVGVMIAFGPIGGALSAAATAGIAAASGAAAYGANKSAMAGTGNLYSGSSVSDLEAAVATAVGMDKHVNFKVDLSKVFDASQEAEDAIEKLEDAALKAQLKNHFAELDAGIRMMHKLADLAYEQAIYDIVGMAQVLKAVNSHAKA